MSCRLFNVDFNNTYRIYLTLIGKHNPGRSLVIMAEGIKEATHALLQRGSKMRPRGPDYPLSIWDMRSVYNTGCGKGERCDMEGVTIRSRAAPLEVISSKLYISRN